MADRVDMSLDEIIKRDRISVGRGRGRGGKFATGRGIATALAGGRGGRKMNVPRKIGATARQLKATGKRSAPATFTTKTRKIPDQWTHDKFMGAGVNDIKSSTLMISNLDFGVNDHDIRELFSEFGPLKKAAVHYDSSGRSLGKAEVVFIKLNDSIRAMKQYNGVTLDGRPMSIQPVVNASAKVNIASRIGPKEVEFKRNSTTPNTKKPIRGRTVAGTIRLRRGRGGKIGRGGTRGTPRKVPTAAELDADLDAYTNKM